MYGAENRIKRKNRDSGEDITKLNSPMRIWRLKYEIREYAT